MNEKYRKESFIAQREVELVKAAEKGCNACFKYLTEKLDQIVDIFAGCPVYKVPTPLQCKEIISALNQMNSGEAVRVESIDGHIPKKTVEEFVNKVDVSETAKPSKEEKTYFLQKKLINICKGDTLTHLIQALTQRGKVFIHAGDEEFVHTIKVQSRFYRADISWFMFHQEGIPMTLRTLPSFKVEEILKTLGRLSG